ncbi:hypothetical protein K4749_04365 [Streptomyces sp. TRM72054]|uniref:hypothetical protein n=1 Tax=Streptomyces sp. TRM72054 TaxID=2870562 RepID=UPI001C8B97C4|nr:hypothetical protein [Streptomyces sp. TRM72054]MBX9392840.1 hypothetical protein [Streptomyces sp. TRM72054]
MTAGKALAMIGGALMLIAGFGASVAGLIALLAGLLSSGDGPPTCDGEVMRPGDQCLITVNGQRSSAGYEEMARRNESAPRDGQIIGGTALGGGVVLLLGGWGLARWSGKGDG